MPRRTAATIDPGFTPVKTIHAFRIENLRHGL